MKLINIEGYEFESDYPLSLTKFNEVPAVYVISTSQNWLDVGETDQLGTRLSNHERKPSWIRCANGLPIYVSVHQEPNLQTRLSIESFLRTRLNPMCGDR